VTSAMAAQLGQQTDIHLNAPIGSGGAACDAEIVRVIHENPPQEPQPPKPSSLALNSAARYRSATAWRDPQANRDLARSIGRACQQRFAQIGGRDSRTRPRRAAGT